MSRSAAKRPRTELTPPSDTSWRSARHQTTLGSDFIYVEPTGTWPTKLTYLEYELPANKVIKFGTKTYFEVFGKLERHVTNEAVANGGQPFTGWRACVEDDLTKCTLAPNFFDFLIKRADLCVGNQIISAHDLPETIIPTLNTFLAYYMSPKVKALLAANPQHPINCMPTDKAWSQETEAWKKYGKTLVESDDGFFFEWLPGNMFPFCQSLNYSHLAEQQSLATNHFEKMYIRLTFRDDLNCVINCKTDADKGKFRLKFSKIRLLLEEDRLNPTIKMPKRNLTFPGHSLSCRYETIPANEKTFKLRFLKSAMPEQLVILCVQKDIVANYYDYSKVTVSDAYKFLKPSNLESVNLIYDGHVLSQKSPNVEEFSKGTISTRILMEGLKNKGLFGMKVDEEKITYANCENEFADTPFPFVVVNYTVPDPHSNARIFPNDVPVPANFYAKDGVIELLMKFNPGAPEDAMFLIFSGFNSSKAIEYLLKLGRFFNRFQNLTSIM